MSRHVELRTVDTRLEILLNRAAKRNALTRDMYGNVAEALENAEGEDGPSAIVLHAAGDCFCAGNDLNDFLSRREDEQSDQVGRFLRALAGSSRVLIAAVQGPAVGIGATMLLHFDYVVAGEEASLRFPFVSLGLVPEAASSLLLPMAVGRLRTAEMLLTGRPLPAEEALAEGLFSQLVPTGEELSAALAFAELVRKLPPLAVAATKRLLKSPTTSISERIAEESREFRQRLDSEEFHTMARKFLAK
jgi:enoyl-CoA hydratase/carnithine racemase